MPDWGGDKGSCGDFEWNVEKLSALGEVVSLFRDRLIKINELSGEGIIYFLDWLISGLTFTIPVIITYNRKLLIIFNTFINLGVEGYIYIN